MPGSSPPCPVEVQHCLCRADIDGVVIESGGFPHIGDPLVIQRIEGTAGQRLVQMVGTFEMALPGAT